MGCPLEHRQGRFVPSRARAEEMAKDHSHRETGPAPVSHLDYMGFYTFLKEGNSTS